MPKIWRVENDTGEGCYQGIDSDLLHENDCNGIKDYNDTKETVYNQYGDFCSCQSCGYEWN